MITLKIIILGLGEQMSGQAAPDFPSSGSGGPGGLAEQKAGSQLALETVSPWPGADGSLVACRGWGGRSLGQGLSLGFLQSGVDSRHLQGSHNSEDRSKAELQDGRRVRNGDHHPPHKHTRNTTICGTTPT